MINLEEFDSSELTREKNLFDIYRQSRKLPGSKHNQIFTLTVLIILSIYAIFSKKPISDLAEEVRAWADLGFNFSATILGFLIAGFTIFATASDPTLFTTIARVRHSSGLLYPKYYFFGLVNVFSFYVLFCVFCLFIRLFASPSGLISLILEFLFKNKSEILLVKRVIVGTGLISVGTFFAFLLAMLQAFIFNIYRLVMTIIRWRVEQEKRELLSSKEPHNDGRV